MDRVRILQDLRLHSWGPALYPPSPYCTIETLSSERPVSMLETTRYVRKKFNIDAVQVSGTNIDQIAKWVDGDIRTDDLGQYIKVRVHRALNDRQTKAYIGDWVLYAGTGFKVYTDKAFKENFEQKLMNKNGVKIIKLIMILQ